MTDKSGDLPILKVLEKKGITMEKMVESALLLYTPCDEVDSQDVKEIETRFEETLVEQCNDINVQLLISAALCLDEEIQENRTRIQGDYSFIVADELIGMAIAEYISGKKALFNFVRYDREKPGILSELDIFLDDAVGGLIAACMTKVFEEWK